MLYGFLLDRASLSWTQGEKWRTEQGDPFVIFTIEEIQKRLHCGNKKATRLLHALTEHRLIRLNRPKKDGPYHITVSAFHQSKEHLGKGQINTCPDVQITPEQMLKQQLNNTDINKTDRNNTDRITLLEREIQSQIEYDFLVANYPKHQVDGVVDVMVQTLASRGATILVSGMYMDAALVKQYLRKANPLRIQYIFEHMDAQNMPISCPRAYYLARLCDPESVVDQFYDTLHETYSF